MNTFRRPNVLLISRRTASVTIPAGLSAMKKENES